MKIDNKLLLISICTLPVTSPFILQHIRKSFLKSKSTSLDSTFSPQTRTFTNDIPPTYESFPQRPAPSQNDNYVVR